MSGLRWIRRQPGGLRWQAIAAKVVLPVEKSAVGHGSVTAKITDFIALDRIDGDNAERQVMISLEDVELLRNVIRQEIENPCFGKIFGKRPGISLAGKVSAAPIPKDHVNPVPLAHTIM